MRKWLLPTVILIAVGYYVYIPIPENAKESWKHHIPALTLRIVNDVTTIAELFGFSRTNTTRTITDMFLQTAKYLQPTVEGVESKDDNFDGIDVRIFRPTSHSEGLLPAVVYIHGGGWTVLSVDDYDSFTRSLSKMSNAVVVSVKFAECLPLIYPPELEVKETTYTASSASFLDFYLEVDDSGQISTICKKKINQLVQSYRLAPEHVFPAAFDDCLKATKYFLQNAAKYGVDASKIGVSGDSAGGNLAMAVSLYLGKEKILPKLNFQGLIYPALQAMDYNLSSYREFDIPSRSSLTPVTKTSMIFYYNMYGFGGKQYIKYFHENTHSSRETKIKYRKYVDPRHLSGKYRMEPEDDTSKENKEIADKIAKVILNPYFAPLMATDEELKLLPKTYLITAEYDGLRDEGMILSHRLRRVNHPLVYKHWDGVEHGFMIYNFYDSYWSGLEHLSSYIRDVSGL